MIRHRIAALGAALFASLAAHSQGTEPRSVSPRGPLLPAEQSVVRLFENAAPAVAYITTERVEQTSFFTVGVAKNAGSGFVWDSQGHIVTNYHVVEGAREVKVQLDTAKPYSARVIGVAPDYDLAVVKLTEAAPGLRPLPLGSSSGNPCTPSATLTGSLALSLPAS